MRNGDSARPESPLICASVEPTERERATQAEEEGAKTREERAERQEGEKNVRIGVGTIDKCTCIPSYCILVQLSAALLPTDRDKVRGGGRETAGNVTAELFYSIMQYLYTRARSDDRGERRTRAGRRSDPDREEEGRKREREDRRKG